MYAFVLGVGIRPEPGLAPVSGVLPIWVNGYRLIVTWTSPSLAVSKKITHGIEEQTRHATWEPALGRTPERRSRAGWRGTASVMVGSDVRQVRSLLGELSAVKVRVEPAGGQ